MLQHIVFMTQSSFFMARHPNH